MTVSIKLKGTATVTFRILWLFKFKLERPCDLEMDNVEIKVLDKEILLSQKSQESE